MGEGAGIAQQVLKLSGEQNQRVALVALPTGACKRQLRVRRVVRNRYPEGPCGRGGGRAGGG